MTQKGKKNVGKITVDEAEMKNVLMGQKDFLVPMVQEAVQTILEVEMEDVKLLVNRGGSDGRRLEAVSERLVVEHDDRRPG